MARRGKFGRLPLAAPSLTNTLVSIAREMQNQRDQTLMDAWQKGGMFEGQKATDELVIAHWRQRLAAVDKNDPLYDTYKNTISQYEYSIAESKASTEYAQGKRSDTAMAQFYLDWAKRVPQNSEFWRVLQRDAAQFMQASKAKGKAAADQAKELAYQQSQNADYQKNEAAGEYITNVLTQLARSNALIGAGSNTDLSQFDTHDPAAMMTLLNTITQAAKSGPNVGKDVPNQGVLYHDPITGQGITGGMISDRLRQLDPRFDGRVTLDYVRGLVRRQLNGQGIRLKRAEDTGHATDVSNLKKWQDYTSESGREMAIWPVEANYQNVRTAFLGTWLSSSSTPESKLAAWQTYASALTKLANDPNVDDSTRSRLMAEVNGDGTVKSLAEDFTGLSSSDNTTTTGVKGDIAETHYDLSRYLVMREAVASGQAYWTTGKTDSNGQFVPSPGGSEIGAATTADITAASPVQPTVIFMPQGTSQPLQVVAIGAEIHVTAKDEQGLPVRLDDANAVGSYYDISVGGLKARVFSFKASDGKTYYTTNPPWADGVTARDGPNGLTLDMSNFVPHRDKQGLYVWPNGKSAETALQSGQGAFGFTDANPTTGDVSLKMRPWQAVYTSDPSRSAAGLNPGTDFFSPTLAALSGSIEGRKLLSNLRDDPRFRAQMELDAQHAATDPTSGAVDQNALALYRQQANNAPHLGEVAQGIGSLLQIGADLWNRANTKPTFDGVIGGPAISHDQRLSRLGEQAAAQLPADTVRNTDFGALGQAFHAGTALLRGATTAPGGTQLQINGTIRVPEAPPRPMLAPTPTPAAPTPTVQPVVPTVPPPPSSATTVRPPSYTVPPAGTPSGPPRRV